MKKSWKRLLSAGLALTLAAGLALPVAAVPEVSIETEELPGVQTEEGASPLKITVGEYTASSEKIRAGGTYTLIALPSDVAKNQGDGNVNTLTPAELVAATGQALFMGSAVAGDDGAVTFRDVRLRTAQAVAYYVTGPGLDTPLVEVTSTSTYAWGDILTDSADHSATITLVDTVTGYHYDGSIQVDSNGDYEIYDVAPGTYDLLVTKPGYLPTTRKEVSINDRNTGAIGTFNLSSEDISIGGQPAPGLNRAGDVTNNGVRDMEDLAALLLYYGRRDVPAGITADLTGDGTVNKEDVELLIYAAGKVRDITTGTVENVQDAKLTVADTDSSSTSALRHLTFSMASTATVSAAAFELTFPASLVQPLKANGGLISPVDGGTLASCLVPASGYTVRLTRWRVQGDTVTLAFAVTADTPKNAGEMVSFYYRPVSGTTDDFYEGVFTLSQAVGLTGKDTVVTDHDLIYPGAESAEIASITIDQEDQTITIPATGDTFVLALSATGHSASAQWPDLVGLTWTVEDETGGAPVGVSVDYGLLTVTDAAQPGNIYITASRGDIISDALTVELKLPDPVAHTVLIQKDGADCTADAIGVAAGDSQATVDYEALVLDQRGNLLETQPDVTWALSGAPAGVSVNGGRLTFDGSTPAGVYTFRLLAQSGSLQATVDITLTVKAQAAALLISGTQSAVAPAPGAVSLTLTYTITAVDAQGSPIALEEDQLPSFDVEPADQGVDAGWDPVSGQYTLTVSPEAKAGAYTLTAQLGDDDTGATGTLAFTLLAYEEPEKPVRAAMFYDDASIQSAQFSFPAGAARTLTFTAQLLDADDSPSTDQPKAWNWEVSLLSDDVSVKDGVLTLAATLPVGSYAFDLKAQDPATKLAVTVPVSVTITPVLGKLTLTAPDSLSIPASSSSHYTLTVTALDSQGTAMPLPEDLVWEVTGATAGVSVADGVLTLTSAALPGDITVTVSDATGAITASVTITLTRSGAQANRTLLLYREITVDGVVVEPLAPVPAAPDAVDAKVGQTVTVTYKALLMDPATGETEAVTPDKWMGAPAGVFQVDQNAESGVYAAKVTAIYKGQSVSGSATVSLYPNITGLLLDFGQGPQPPYELAVPSKGSRYYTATVLAQLKDGTTVPLIDLGLADYDVVMATALTGLYATMDKTTGEMTFQVDAAAVQNPTSAPSTGRDIRYILLYLDYFPNDPEPFEPEELPLYLKPEAATVTTAILRRGTGTGTSFSFGTPQTGEVTTAAAGTLSNCYALELLDQYGNAMTGRDTEWTLHVPDELIKDKVRLVKLVEPGSAIESAYPDYVSIRRLQISPQAPAGGPYKLTLTASCAGKTCTLPILLQVEATPGDIEMSLSGLDAITIPMYYAQYNSATVNNNTNSATYTAILRTSSGAELDLSQGYSLAWSVTDANGKVPAGVTLTPSAGTASATVKVDRTAQPTGALNDNKLLLTAQLKSGQSVVAQGAMRVELNRSTSVPTLMSARKNGATVASDTFSMASGGTEVITRDYTFHLLDQYNQIASLKDRRKVTWSVPDNAANSGLTLTVLQDAEGVSYARVTVANPGRTVNATIYLTASITIAEEKAANGQQVISVRLPLYVKVGSSGNLGGGGGGGGMGDTDTSSSTPTSIAITGNTSLNTTQGTVASQTYSCTLRTANGATASLSDQAKVVWSATGLASGISFNTATHVLTVPATTPAGVYKVILTARYSSSVSTSVTVTVNVANPSGGTPTSIAINGTSSISTTQGTAVTKAWSATLKDANGTVVTVPSVTWSLSPLSSGNLTVQFDPSTATLTVPATAGVGTLNATLTVTYGTLKATLPITVTVTAAQASTPAAPTIVPSLTTSGTKGSATLTAQQEKAITDSTVNGGVITVAPTGSSNLTSATVNISAATVKTMTGKNQSLRVKTDLGTVLLPPQALSALVGQGGSTVSVTFSSSGGTVSVTFACGYEAASLPGIISFTAPTSGNVALKVGADGAKTVVKKAVVKNGNVYTYINGSTQLQLETRSPSFADTQSHWAREAVAFTAARELFQGTSATAFSPNATMTRSMIVTVLHRLEDTPATASAVSFADVPGGQWYTDAVAWANQKGIVQGTGDGFKPNDPVTREQLAKILYAYASSLGLATNQRTSLTSFSDYNRVSSWASEPMQWAVSVGLINGKTGNLLDPTGNASRAEVSTILQRMITNVLIPSV